MRPNDPDRPGCRWGRPGALNRLFLNDVRTYSSGSAWNGYADLGLVTVQYAVMTTLVHEIGHSWMFWPPLLYRASLEAEPRQAVPKAQLLQQSPRLHV